MNALKNLATAALLAAPLMLLGAQAEATTARQLTFQGQGLYTTSKGLPENFIGGASAQQDAAGAQDGNRIRDFEHHNRYFGGY